MNSYFNFSPDQYNNGEQATDTVYSDRLHQWDHTKHNELCRKHFNNEGQYWSGREPEAIEAFLRDYHDRQDLVLCRVKEYENQSTGYPYWRFDYKFK